MSNDDGGSEALLILRALLAEQGTQNRLLSVLVDQTNASMQSKQAGCAAWKKVNRDLSKRCTQVTVIGNEILTELVEEMVEDLEQMSREYNFFNMCEFVDKYGSRFQQFGTMLQSLSDLGS